ncbi:hypothetical protein [Brumicola nitratireducens]|uniref:Uncharacterized protein n=1 Tax=Glaciecola nitratireducens (strain JCM 12485 / KCTC 12276 / FR1064) TaxID=1085623 RepID=G4QH78_GLANF|nr:hypothetical protein [Glaciecola nitratireducens]AEP29709.1 hypothetical protein GNIT_1592 [Glaciecola nitratireducens FR1064]
MALNEDNRAASGLMTNLSGFIITANLSMLAVQGASYAFVANESEQTSLGYNVLSVLAFCCFVVSIIVGGKGITETAVALAKSSWTIKTATKKFNFQAIVSFFGVVLFLVASIFFTEKHDDNENINRDLLIEVSTINRNLNELTEAIKNDPKDLIKNVKGQIELLQKDLSGLEYKLFNNMPSQICKVIDAKVDGGKLFCPDGFALKGAEKHSSKNGTLDKIICCK